MIMKYNPIIIALIAGIVIIASACLFSNAYRYKFKSSQTITVNGNAKKDFESDLVKWNASYSRKNFDLKGASDQLAEDRELVRNFLIAQGLKAEEIRFEAVNINKEFEYHTDGKGSSYNTFSGYTLSQTVGVESKDLNKVDNASREISTLISQGLELSSSTPNYYYSKLEDLKLELISQASKNAHQRAQNIASESASTLGQLVKADLGVFQITGQNDNEEFSYGGAFNTTSRKKTANITVKASYLPL
ncbi:hypothetical protein EDF67_10694 [Sphingobacterium sp. JUb78]|nr:hypothetical protein EDF67_10694 [Sphingobacterium sp. JUb78]